MGLVHHVLALVANSVGSELSGSYVKGFVSTVGSKGPDIIRKLLFSPLCEKLRFRRRGSCLKLETNRLEI